MVYTSAGFVRPGMAVGASEKERETEM